MVYTLKESRRKMEKALKDIVVVKIRDIGFSGSFPHFRRVKNNRFEFLSFQFYSYGGSFVVEVGYGTKADLPEFARELPFEKLNYSYVGKRSRITPDNLKNGFGLSYESFTDENQFIECAELVKSLLWKAESFLEINVRL